MNLKMLVEACQKNPAECDSKKVGDDERVEGAGFQTRWSWLREVLSSAHNARQSDREKQLQEAAARLDEDAVLAADAAPQTADTFPRARKQADDVLSRPEFRTVTEASYWQREIAKLWQWVAEIAGVCGVNGAVVCESWSDAGRCRWGAAKLLKFLEEQCGVPRDVLRSTPQAIVEAVEERLGGRWSMLGEHLTQASETEHHAVTLVSTLELVKALDRDQRNLAERMRPVFPGERY
jgi:hypothetical protein